jgi:hypothetical protein
MKWSLRELDWERKMKLGAFAKHGLKMRELEGGRVGLQVSPCPEDVSWAGGNDGASEGQTVLIERWTAQTFKVAVRRGGGAVAVWQCSRGKTGEFVIERWQRVQALGWRRRGRNIRGDRSAGRGCG